MKTSDTEMVEIPLSNGGNERSTTISFHDLQYIVSAKENRKKIQKYVLKDVSGVFHPGMNAILGPTGSGKTSLLDFLAGRKDKSGFDGNILVNGQKIPDDFKNISGYVVQDDVVMGTLTVCENLTFSAALRLPNSVSAEERKQRVEDIITELGLKDCRNTRVLGDALHDHFIMMSSLFTAHFLSRRPPLTKGVKVGTEFTRGVSGGERKRVNIGMELITKPAVLFLDEPTTGLDSSTAQSVISLLHSLALKGKTIIFSIHQPRFSIYRHFDKLHLLSKGKTVYHGQADQALDFFAQAGYQCEEHNNPPDFFLDVIIEENSSVTYVTKGKTENGDTNAGQTLTELFKQSSYGRALQTEAAAILQGTDQSVATTQFKTGYASSWFKQLYFVSKRASTNFIRNPQVSIFQPLVTVVFALIVGGLFWQLDTSEMSGIQNRVGASFFLVTNMLFANAAATELFISEKVIFIHESASGYYRVSTYFLAKVFCDLVPMRVTPTIIYCAITYWMIGFVKDAGKFFFFGLTLLLTTLSGTSVTFFYGASIRNSTLANLATTMTYVVMLIFGGLFLNINSLPTWLQWLQYTSLARYGLNALSINELDGQVFTNNVTGRMEYGTDYLTEQGIRHDAWGLWQNCVALGAYILILMFLAYVQLRRIPKTK